MTVTQKIEKAKVKLMVEQPYFGTISSALSFKVNSELLTFESDGTQLSYNDEYLDRLTVEETEFVLANAAMHSQLKHLQRTNHRIAWLWQSATDYVVNAMLIKNGMTPPEHIHYELDFEGMYAEEIYSILYSKIKNKQEEEQEDTQENHKVEQTQLREFNDVSDEAQNDLLAEEIFLKYKRQGTLPKDIALLLPESFSNRVHWQEYLQNYIATYAKSTYRFSPPNMKYFYQGIYLPSLYSDLLRIVVAIDTSGSIDATLLENFLGELSSIMQQFPNYEIELITADMKIQSVHTFVAGEVLKCQLTGGGGTDYRPVFEYIEKHIDTPNVLLYFTDAQGIYPQEEPHYDMLWLLPKSCEVPFGEVVVLEESV